MALSSYDTYCLYLAIKQHFNQEKYDYFMYKGKVNASLASLNKRKDKYHFTKLSKKFHTVEELRMFLVSNILQDIVWVGDFLGDKADQNYTKHKKRIQSLSYSISNEMDILLKNSSPSEIFKSQDSEYPVVLTRYIQNDISLDLMVILDDFTGFSVAFDNRLGETEFMWSKIRYKMKKYRPFLEYDKNSIKKIMKEKLFPS